MKIHGRLTGTKSNFLHPEEQDPPHSVETEYLEGKNVKEGYS